MPIGPDAPDEKFDSSGQFDLIFELVALLDQVRHIAIQNVDVSRVDINVLQGCEILPYLTSAEIRMTPTLNKL